MAAKKLRVVWKGETFTDDPSIIEKALRMRKPEEQKEFVELVCSFSPHMRSNIGYYAGYYDSETSQRIFKVFETAHPIFGTTTPSPEEAFKAGWELGKAAKEGKGGG